MSDAPYAEIEREFASAATSEAVLSLSRSEREKLREYWLARADGELTTALSFEFMLEDLMQLGAPPELRALAQRAIGDEHKHADWCLRWAKLLDPTQPASAKLVGTRPLEFDVAEEHDQRLLRIVFGGCFSETVAIHVLRASHAQITLNSVRRLNHVHMKEELDHARLGWAFLGWSGLSQRDRDMLRAQVPALTALTRATWMGSRRASSPVLHALGYMSGPLVDAACEEALESVIMPGLARLGAL
ncbi:MAG: ferritin-like domain-containing protein [Myxococcota bacterium]